MATGIRFRHAGARRGAGLLVCGLALVLVGSAPLLVSGAVVVETERVSVSSAGSQALGGSSEYSSISADGRYVAFDSDADNLVAGDTNDSTDVFVHDRATGETGRVSVTSAGAQTGLGNSAEPSISGDGRYVAFHSRAEDLVLGDSNGEADVFVHDRATGQTTRVSVTSGGLQAKNGRSEYPSISADGRYVAFRSLADNLVPGDTNGQADIFVHDRVTGGTVRASTNSGSAQANAGSEEPAISADGRCVAFSSSADNLVSGDSNGQQDVFVKDRLTGQTTRVNVSSSGEQALDHGAFGVSISGDGRLVAFCTRAENLVLADTNGDRDVFVHDRGTGTTVRASVGSGGVQSDGGGSEYPSLSPDGRYVAFASGADNLVSGDTNDRNDIFVHGIVSAETVRMSLRTGGIQPDFHSNNPALGTGGRFVSYYSGATNLVADDSNGLVDVLVSKVQPAVAGVAGSDRYQTAIAASKDAYPNGLMTDAQGNRTVVIATGENWPDALGGSALAGAYNGPILLTPAAALPSAVATEIDRLMATDAIILGGPGAVGPAVESALAGKLGVANVRRIGGSTRYETAELIARAVANAPESRFDGKAFVATGRDFPDALAASPLATAGHHPILLVSESGLTASTRATMSDIGVVGVAILGGRSVVSEDVEDALSAAVSEGVVRLAGATRYETAVAIARFGVAEASTTFAYTGLATGENFPDALAGGVLQGRDRGVLLLTQSAKLTPSTRAAIESEADRIATVRFFGGPGALGSAVRTEVAQILQ